MHRIDGDGAVAVIPTPESVGSTVGYFQKGNPATGTKATQVTADWCNAIQEEIVGAIENKGISLDKTNRGQLKTAIARRKIRSVINSNLTIDPADLDELFLVSTGISNRTISLPPASETAGVGMKFIKVDDGVGSVELVPDGSETISGLSSLFMYTKDMFFEIVSDGSNYWIIDEGEEYFENLSPTISGAGTSPVGKFWLRKRGQSVGSYCEITSGTGSPASSLQLVEVVPSWARPGNTARVTGPTDTANERISTVALSSAGTVSIVSYDIDTNGDLSTVNWGTGVTVGGFLNWTIQKV